MYLLTLRITTKKEKFNITETNLLIKSQLPFKNLEIKSNRLQGEFDLVMFNGENIALIECKYKAHKSDVEKLITKQVESFKKLFPIYANHKFYLGIASFSFYPELEQFARENGVAILKQKGEVVEIVADNLKAY